MKACLLAFALTLAGQAALADSAPLPLTVVNQTAAPLRCVVVLAHFITRDVGPLAPGAGETLLLDRDLAGGTLAYGTHNGAPMWVENILCGEAARWQETRDDVSLLALRADPGERFQLLCRDGQAPRCGIAALPPS